MIRNIIFDCGGIFIKDERIPIGVFLSIFFDGDEEKLKTVWEENKGDLLTGKISSQDFLKKVEKIAKAKFTLEEIYKHWEKYQSINEKEGVNWEVVDLVKKLKIKYNLYMLTDVLDIRDKTVIENIYPLFIKVYRSNEEGSRKRNREAFLNFLKKSEIKPEESLFIDNFETNTQVAESVGIKSIFYKNFGQLEEELAELNIAQTCS